MTSGTLVPGRSHVDIARDALAGGATAIQLRAPELDAVRALPIAAQLAVICAEAHALFVVNDLLKVALEAGPHVGLHLGQEDDLAGTRARLGEHRALGISVATPQEAERAGAMGADYLGVSIWSTATKPDAVPMGLNGLGAIARATSLPIVGIGGIDASNARRVLAAGATGVAVISAIAATPDPVAATREIVRVVETHRSRQEGTPR